MKALSSNKKAKRTDFSLPPLPNAFCLHDGEIDMDFLSELVDEIPQHVSLFNKLRPQSKVTSKTSKSDKAQILSDIVSDLNLRQRWYELSRTRKKTRNKKHRRPALQMRLDNGPSSKTLT